MAINTIYWYGKNIIQDSSNRLVTDSEKSTWNGKAAADHNHDSVYAKKDDVNFFETTSVTNPAGKVYTYHYALSDLNDTDGYYIGYGYTVNSTDRVTMGKLYISAREVRSLYGYKIYEEYQNSGDDTWYHRLYFDIGKGQITKSDGSNIYGASMTIKYYNFDSSTSGPGSSLDEIYVNFPEKSGTLALTSDLDKKEDAYILLADGTDLNNITEPGKYKFVYKYDNLGTAATNHLYVDGTEFATLMYPSGNGSSVRTVYITNETTIHNYHGWGICCPNKTTSKTDYFDVCEFLAQTCVAETYNGQTYGSKIARCLEPSGDTTSPSRGGWTGTAYSGMLLKLDTSTYSYKWSSFKYPSISVSNLEIGDMQGSTLALISVESDSDGKHYYQTIPAKAGTFAMLDSNNYLTIGETSYGETSINLTSSNNFGIKIGGTTKKLSILDSNSNTFVSFFPYLNYVELYTRLRMYDSADDNRTMVTLNSDSYAGNTYGSITLFSPKKYAYKIVPNYTADTGITVQLPETSGILALKSDTHQAGSYYNSNNVCGYYTSADATTGEVYMTFKQKNTYRTSFIRYCDDLSALVSTGGDVSGFSSIDSGALAVGGFSGALMVSNIISSNGYGGINIYGGANRMTITPIGTVKDKSYLGWASQKWTEIYATNGTIQTSNELKKNIIKDGIDSRYEELYKKLEPIAFRWNNDTADGSNHDRIHLGLGAQTTKRHMDEVGISAEEYALYCEDTTEETNEETGEVTSTTEYGINYGQLHALHIHMIQKLLKENEELKSRLSKLEELVSSN